MSVKERIERTTGVLKDKPDGLPEHGFPLGDLEMERTDLFIK